MQRGHIVRVGLKMNWKLNELAGTIFRETLISLSIFTILCICDVEIKFLKISYQIKHNYKSTDLRYKILYTAELNLS